MEDLVRDSFEKAIFNYSKEGYKDDYLKAQEEFFNLTGSVNEEHENFDQRMNSFYEWYFFNFSESKILNDFIENVDEKLISAFKDYKYSLFEYGGKNVWGRGVFKDFIGGEKIQLPKKSLPQGVMKDDIIIGRFVKVDDGYLLLSGFFILPKKVRPILKREAKRVAKIGDIDKKEEYLLRLEGLYNKWRRYHHLDPSKIFVYGP